jgi:hypothetical protein
MQQKMRSAGQMVAAFMEGGVCAQIVAEMPTFFSSEKGRIAAKEGYTINLALVLGSIIGRFDLVAEQKMPVQLYTPGMWKGQVSKEITRKKFFRTFKDASGGIYDNDTVDAIMILSFWLEKKYPQVPVQVR